MRKNFINVLINNCSFNERKYLLYKYNVPKVQLSSPCGLTYTTSINKTMTVEQILDLFNKKYDNKLKGEIYFNECSNPILDLDTRIIDYGIYTLYNFSIVLYQQSYIQIYKTINNTYILSKLIQVSINSQYKEYYYIISDKNDKLNFTIPTLNNLLEIKKLPLVDTLLLEDCDTNITYLHDILNNYNPYCYWVCNDKTFAICDKVFEKLRFVLIK